MPRRICLAANFSFTHLGSAWQRALESIGVEVLPFDVRAERAGLGWIARNRIAHRLTIGSYLVRRRAALAYNRALLDRVASGSVDALVLHNGEFVFPETLARVRALGVKVVIFHADNPFPPHYNNRPETLPAAREADLYLTWSERLAEKLGAAGVRDARFLPFAWDSTVYPFETPPPAQWEGVLFVGTWDPAREALLDRVAERFPLRIYGSEYWGRRTSRRSAARRCWMGRELTGPDAARAIRESAICLNVLRTQHYVDGRADGLIMRNFEVPGAGGFLLSTRSGGATRIFPPGDAADYFDDAGDCLRKIEAHLLDAAERRAIARRAHERVAAAHRYVHRMTELVRMLDELS